MKTMLIKKIGLALIGALVMTNCFATDPEVKLAGDKKIMVKLGAVKEITTLVIKETSGSVVYLEDIAASENPYVKIFNLATFPDGDYLIEVEGSLKINSYALSILNDKISTYNIAKTEIFKPALREKDNKVYLTKFNPENSNLGITILDKNDHVIYEETLAGDINLGRIYNFSKLSGEYRISMSDGDKTYTQVVSIDK